MQHQRTHRSRSRYALLCIMLGLCAFPALAQDPVRTVELNLFSNSNYIIHKAPSGLSSGWTLVWPSTVGTTGSLLVSTVSGSVNTQSWLVPGTNGQVLSLVGGTPTWVDNNSNWLLTGNANATATNFLGPTTASIPLNIATANATPGDINFYLGTVAPANLRMNLSTATGLAIGNATNSVNTAVTGTLSSTGNTTLASTAGSTVTLTNATGSLTVNGTALTPNVTMTSLSGVAKATLPVGYDRVVVSNATGQLDQATYSAVVGNVAWVLAGNSNAVATSFLGPTTASIPLNIATANAIPGDINFYLGTVAPANLRMNLSTATGLAIGNATNSVNTAVTGTLSSTGNTTLASTAGSTVTLTNATGSLTVNGTALTPNVTMTSLSGVAKATLPVGYDRVVVSNATGQLDQATYSAVIGNVAWVLAGNSNAVATSFLGPTTASIPLNIATANATPGDINFYLGTVAPANLRMNLSTATGLAIGNATNSVNTAVTGTLSSTGNTTLATTAGSTVTLTNATGSLTVNGTALTPNVTMTSLSGVAKAALPVGYDRVVISNATGQLDEATYSAVVGNVAWVLSGNSNAIATSFLGPTTASIPLNIATANATPGDINFYLGTVAAANLRMNLSTATGLAIGNATNSVNTAVTGTLSSTGNTTLASTAGSTVTLTNATGSLTVNGTALTSNVTMTSLSGVARAALPVGYDRVLISNATGQVDQASYSAVVGSVAWVLAGNATASAWNGAAGSFLGTTSAQPLSIATTNATAQDIRFYTGANGANERMRLNATGELGIGTTSAVGQLLTVNGTAGTPNITFTELGGVAKVALPVGYDRVVISNATGQLDEATYSAVVGNVAWVLSGNSNAVATSFLGPTTASIPMNIATANATPGDINFYLGTVAPANLRMNLSTASGLAIGNATNSVNTAVTGTLSSTGNTTLASTAGSTVTLTNATGSLTVNGTALTSNVTMTSLSGVARAALPVGYDRVLISNATGQVDQATYSAVVGSVAWVLAGNATASAWNGAAGSFLGTTSAQPLSIATTNATAQDIRFYTGANGANERMRLNATGELGIGTTSAVGQLLTVNGTAGTPNITFTELGGVAKAALPVGYDRVVISNATGQLDEATYSAVVGNVAWVLSGNSNAIATSFLGPTTASIPLNIATANATPGDINFYLGTVAAANLRMNLSTATGLAIGNATNSVNTAVTGTLSSTGNTTLASTAGSTVTLTNATGSLTVNGTTLTPNVTMTSLSGVARVALPLGYDRVVVSNATGQLDQATYSAVVGSVAWVLAGNATASAWNGAAGSFLGTTSAQPLSIATTNAAAQDIRFYTGALGASERMRIMSTGEVGVGTSAPLSNARLHTVGTAPSVASTGFGLRADVTSVAAATGIGAYISTSGATGALFPLVVSSQNNATVYLGSSAADIPAALATLLTGTSNVNTTYMFNGRMSGSLTLVGSTSGTVSFQAPTTIATNHTYTMPNATGTSNQVLRIASSPAPTASAATLEWATAATAPVFARRTSNQSYATTVLANDGQLVLSLTANDIFEFEAMVAFSGTTSAAAMQLAFTIPLGASIRWGIVNASNAAVSPASITASGTAISDIPVNSTTSTNEQVLFVKGLVVMGATAGSLQLQAAATTAATTVTIGTNSFIKATKVN